MNQSEIVIYYYENEDRKDSNPHTQQSKLSVTKDMELGIVNLDLASRQKIPAFP